MVHLRCLLHTRRRTGGSKSRNWLVSRGLVPVPSGFSCSRQHWYGIMDGHIFVFFSGDVFAERWRSVLACWLLAWNSEGPLR